MLRLIKLVAIITLLSGCDSDSSGGKTVEITLNEDELKNLPKNTKNMDRLENVMGTLLETWEQRYTFEHDREDPKLTFEVPGFTLTVVEEGDDDQVALLFEETGTKHKAVCSVDEAPRVIESLLFPESVE